MTTDHASQLCNSISLTCQEATSGVVTNVAIFCKQTNVTLLDEYRVLKFWGKRKGCSAKKPNFQTNAGQS